MVEKNGWNQPLQVCCRNFPEAGWLWFSFDCYPPGGSNDCRLHAKHILWHFPLPVGNQAQLTFGCVSFEAPETSRENGDPHHKRPLPQWQNYEKKVSLANFKTMRGEKN